MEQQMVMISSVWRSNISSEWLHVSEGFCRKARYLLAIHKLKKTFMQSLLSSTQVHLSLVQRRSVYDTFGKKLSNHRDESAL